MLLLLLSNLKFQLKDQFDLRQGVSLSGANTKRKPTKDSSNIYKVVNLSGLDSCSGQILENKLVDYAPVREIPADKLISKNDYLISCKGEVKGYSMLFSENLISIYEKEAAAGGIVASNHFLILRPRMMEGLKLDDIYFLHNLLNIISGELREIALSKPGAAKYLTINDVASYSFNFPLKESSALDEFKSIYTKYLKSQENLRKCESELREYNYKLASKILLK